MSDIEFKTYRQPVFECDEGCTCDRKGNDPHADGCRSPIVVGLLPVAKRLFLELFLPSNSEKELHGTDFVPRGVLDNLVKDNNHCLSCLCVFGRHCQYCKAVPKVEKNFPTVGANVVVVEKRKPFIVR